MFFRTTLLVVVCAVATCEDADAQKLKFGLLTGVSLTDDYRPTTFTFPNSSGGGYFAANASQALLVGASADVELRKNLAVEVNAIRRRIRSTLRTIYPPSAGTPPPSLTFLSDNFEWHFAVLGKYRFATTKTVTPFIEAGGTFLPQENRDRTGFTSGAGVEIPFRRINIAPTLRHTRWLTHPSLGAVQDQLQFVVGIRSLAQGGFGRRRWPDKAVSRS
jgi:hypothetical protein